jgi:hypothetical protein
MSGQEPQAALLPILDMLLRHGPAEGFNKNTKNIKHHIFLGKTHVSPKYRKNNISHFNVLIRHRRAKR